MKKRKCIEQRLGKIYESFYIKQITGKFMMQEK